MLVTRKTQNAIKSCSGGQKRSKATGRAASKSNFRDESFKIHTNDKVASDGSALSDPRMSGLKQKKAADGVNKKQRKSSKGSAAVAASKDKGGTTSNKNAGSNSTAERPQPSHSPAASPSPSVSAAPVPSVRRGKCIKYAFSVDKKNIYGCSLPRFIIRMPYIPTYYV